MYVMRHRLVVVFVMAMCACKRYDENCLSFCFIFDFIYLILSWFLFVQVPPSD